MLTRLFGSAGSTGIAATQGVHVHPRRKRRGSRSLGNTLLWLAFLALGVPSLATAQDASVVRWLRAERLAAAGNCEEALPLLRDVRKSAPKHARAALFEGQCAVELRRYAEAIEPLKAAKRLDPSLSDADLSLAIALYHLGEYARAERALDAFEKSDPDRAELHLYRGLILLQRAETREAAASDPLFATVADSAID